MCRNSGRDLKACTGCYKAFYCNSNCQQNNWGRHKIDCNSVQEIIQKKTQFITILFSEAHCLQCQYFYWGNVAAFDCLNLVKNEGESYDSDLHVLHLGVGDLRNVALTCASLPDSYTKIVSFTLNDKESCVLARLVLFLYMLIKGKPRVEKIDTEIWYSIQLCKSTYESLTLALQELINCTTTHEFQKTTSGLIAVNKSQLHNLKLVWKSWFELKVQDTTSHNAKK
ncbi:uncharacterized protein LOC124435716 [Xenia sp. Carnegie-2017]|uniref:uncharacterized protein LOC124435716 n=1 Tax=Xenia sp. Carnegie-2017 TaxID=2897299 RepID=UPI001F042367|nr:uncharacterized protein LOC124435716 [Xenia sp. Carnegie-2017]